MIVTTSEIILGLIKQKGFKNINQFSVYHKINPKNLREYIKTNIWGPNLLKRMGKLLNVDLSGLETRDYDGDRI